MSQIFEFIGGSVLPIFFIIIIIVLIVSYIGSRYKVAGANEALIVSRPARQGPGRRSGTSRWSAVAASSSCRSSTRSASSS